MLGLVALAAAYGWISPEVRRSVEMCRFELEAEDDREYRRRRYVNREHLTEAEAHELDARCTIFVLGQAEQYLFSAELDKTNPR